MKHLLLLTLTLGFTFSSAHADGDKGGNGGKAVRCPDGRYEVLDYQRMREFGLTAITDIEGSTELEKALNIVKRIEGINPLRADYYARKLRSFQADSISADDGDMIQMTVTDDTDEVAYCLGGKIEQVIRQITPKTDRQKPYLVHSKRFAKLSLFQRAILMVHEVILGETRARSMKGADAAVTLNTFLISRELDVDLRAENAREIYARTLQAAGLLYSILPDQGDVTLEAVKKARDKNPRQGMYVSELSYDVAVQPTRREGYRPGASDLVLITPVVRVNPGLEDAPLEFLKKLQRNGAEAGYSVSLFYLWDFFWASSPRFPTQIEHYR